MSVEQVRAFFAERRLHFEIRELTESTGTVELAARALGVEPALIAKTLAFTVNGRGIIVVTTGDARIDNKKFRKAFQAKARMMSPEEVLETTGHPVGGVCPFGLKNPLDIYLDVGLKRHARIYPAAGSVNSHIRITPGELCIITGGTWVDVCRDGEEDAKTQA